MNKLYILLIVFPLAFFYSCNGEKKGAQLQEVKEITYKGVSIIMDFQTYYDAATDEEFTMFFNHGSPSTPLKVYETYTGMHLYDVPLADVWDTLGPYGMRGFLMLAKDTFCATTENNRLCLFTKNGGVFKFLDLTPFSKWDNAKMLFSVTSNNPNKSSTKNIYLKVEAIPEPQLTISSELERIKKEEFIRYSVPHLSKLILSDDTMALELYLPHFRNTLLGERLDKSFSAEVAVVRNEELVYMSRYVDSVFVFDLQTNSKKRSYKLESNFTKLGLTPCDFYTVGYTGQALQNCSNINNVQNGYASRLFYNEKYGVYFTCVFHPYDGNLLEDFYKKDFSIMALDDFFKNVSEKKFSQETHHFYFQPCREGLLVQKKNKDKTSKIIDEKVTCALYSVL